MALKPERYFLFSYVNSVDVLLYRLATMKGVKQYLLLKRRLKLRLYC